MTAGLALRTLADHCALTIRAFCQACGRSVALNHQALADRDGWDVPARRHPAAAQVPAVRETDRKADEGIVP